MLAACSTPARRISKHQDYYNTLSAEQQQLIAEGGIKPGFSSKMVFLAFGAPNRKYKRTTADGVRSVWSYTSTEYRRDHDWVDVPLRVRGSDGRSYRTRERVRVEVEHEREIERVRVEFADDKVTAIEELTDY